MNIGDKIKLTRGGETGKVVKILSNSMYDIELDDGFNIEVHMSEITLVHRTNDWEDEDEEIEEVSNDNQVKEAPKTDQYLILEVDNSDHRVSKLSFKNDTKFDYHIFVFSKTHTSSSGLYSFILNANSVINQSLNKQKAGTSDVVIQYIKFQENTHPFPIKELQIDIHHRADFDDHNSGINIKYLDGNTGHQTSEIDVSSLQEAMQSTNTVAPKVAAPEDEIDLHIEALFEGEVQPNENHLSIQLGAFQSSLEAAIANDMDHITFIHGVGNGILRMEIHKRLSKRGDIKWFEDARKEKFGYGATYVQLK